DMTSIKSDFEIVYPDEDDITSDELGAYYEKLKRVVSWVKNSDETTFKAELEQYFNKEYLIKYFLQAHMFGMVDNLGKNMFLRTWDGNVWYPTFYDLDSELGLDNTGYLKFQSDIDIVEGVYNTSSSKLFVMLQTCFADDIKSAYKKLRMDKRYSMETVMSYWYGQQVGVIGESQYNKDMEAKYIAYKNDYLFMMHGRRYEHLKKWLKERFLYLDTIYGYEADTSASITIRANKAATISIDVLTYSPQYLTVKWKNGDGGIQKLKCGRDANGNMTPTRFTGTLTTATDQEVIIYNAKQIKKIDGLSNLNPSVLNLVEASRLTEIVCEKSTLLTDIRISSNNKFIKDIKLSGCKNLGTSTGGGNQLDLSPLTNISHVDLGSTALQNVLFPTNGCNLKFLWLPTTVQSLHLENMPLLSSGQYLGYMYSYSNLYIKGCPNMNPLIKTNGDKSAICINASSIHLEDVKMPKCEEVVFNSNGNSSGSYDTLLGVKYSEPREIESLYLNNVDCSNIRVTKINFAFPETSVEKVKEFEITSSCKFKELYLTKLGLLEEKEVDLSNATISSLRVVAPSNISLLKVRNRLNGLFVSTNNNKYSNGNLYDNYAAFNGNRMTGFYKTYDENNLQLSVVGCSDANNILDLSTMNITKYLSLDFKDAEKYEQIKINCDFPSGNDGSFWTSGFNLFKLPITAKITGLLKSSDTCRIWCSCSETSYTVQENFDELDIDLHEVTYFTTIFKEWRNLKKLPSNIAYIFDGSIKNHYKEAFYNCINLVDLGDLNGADIIFNLSQSNALENTWYKVNNTPISLGNITFTQALSSVNFLYSLPEINAVGNITFPDSHDGQISILEGKQVESVGNIYAPKCKSAKRMLKGCQKLTTLGNITLSPECTSFELAFSNCKLLESSTILESLNFSSYNSGYTCYSMFSYCESLTDDIWSNDFIDFICKATTLSLAFSNCPNLVHVPSLESDTITSCENIFLSCTNLETIEKISFPNCTNSMYAFRQLTKLSSINYLNLGKLTSSQDKTQDSPFWGVTGLRHCIVRQTIYKYKPSFLLITNNNRYDSESLESIIENLEDSTATGTLNFQNTASLTEEQIAIASSKGWTVTIRS
ncbi:MAG: CotH kinase family protein, partial [Candidatus Izemoplasmatales bacterium]|nr:CotH kinase family protein [Candidatus Izemoplasmatales bacterium]